MLKVSLNVNINLKKVQSQLTKVIITDLDILSTDICIPYSVGFMYVK